MIFVLLNHFSSPALDLVSTNRYIHSYPQPSLPLIQGQAAVLAWNNHPTITKQPHLNFIHLFAEFLHRRIYAGCVVLVNLMSQDDIWTIFGYTSSVLPVTPHQGHGRIVITGKCLHPVFSVDCCCDGCVHWCSAVEPYLVSCLVSSDVMHCAAWQRPLLGLMKLNFWVQHHCNFFFFFKCASETLNKNYF